MDKLKLYQDDNKTPRCQYRVYQGPVLPKSQCKRTAKVNDVWCNQHNPNKIDDVVK